MTAADTLFHPSAAPRTRDAEATRAAGVDVVLVKRYFSGEEALFLEALRAWFGADGVC